MIGFTDALVVAASGNNSIAIDQAAKIWTWGANFSGQLGTGDLDDRNQPNEREQPIDVRAIAQGLGHTLVLDADGTFWVWGLNSFGQLGNGLVGNDNNSSEPLAVDIPE